MDLCFFKNICPKYSKGLNIENLNLKIPRIIKQPPTQPYGLPRFIPVVSVLDKSSWIWRRLKVTHIVRLSELLQCREVLDSICREGIHNYLNFDGKVILSTIMPDELIGSMEIERLKTLIRRIKPDIIMTLDRPTYIDDPQAISWIEVLRLLKSALDLAKLGLPVMGIIKGADKN